MLCDCQLDILNNVIYQFLFFKSVEGDNGAASGAQAACFLPPLCLPGTCSPLLAAPIPWHFSPAHPGPGPPGQGEPAHRGRQGHVPWCQGGTWQPRHYSCPGVAGPPHIPGDKPAAHCPCECILAWSLQSLEGCPSNVVWSRESMEGETPCLPSPPSARAWSAALQMGGRAPSGSLHVPFEQRPCVSALHWALHTVALALIPDPAQISLLGCK